MSEAEFDRLLDAVRIAVAPAPEEDFMVADPASFERLPKPANDNHGAWPLLPFPEGSLAAC